MNEIIRLDRMSFDRAMEIAEQTQSIVKGYLINDLVLHYGCEIIYKLKSLNKTIIVDFPLIGPPSNVINSLRILIAGGADFITIDHSLNYQLPNKFLSHCVLSVISYRESGHSDESFQFRNYPYALCKNKQISFFKAKPEASETTTKLIVTTNHSEPSEAEYVVRDWWVLRKSAV